jgi:hypothetical protein
VGVERGQARRGAVDARAPPTLVGLLLVVSEVAACSIERSAEESFFASAACSPTSSAGRAEEGATSGAEDEDVDGDSVAVVVGADGADGEEDTVRAGVGEEDEEMTVDEEEGEDEDDDSVLAECCLETGTRVRANRRDRGECSRSDGVGEADAVAEVVGTVHVGEDVAGVLVVLEALEVDDDDKVDDGGGGGGSSFSLSGRESSRMPTRKRWIFVRGGRSLMLCSREGNDLR